MNVTSNQSFVDPLFYNISCEGPHSDEAKVYTYILSDGFVGVSTFLAVINFVAMLPTAGLNLLIIYVFVQQKNIRTTSSRLLFSICAADFLIGVLIEPIFGAHVIHVTKGKQNCGLSNFLIYAVPVLIVITMVTHMLIAMERYCSMHYTNFYKRVFTKRYITWLIALTWAACLFCFVLPFITGDPVLGTRIIVTFILVSLAVCSFCYISMYQDFKWQDGKPTAKIKGAYIIRGMESTERSVTEKEEFQKNVRISSFYFKLFICMVIFYVLNLTKNALNSYEIFKGNGHYIVHFLFDTVLFLNALVNPCIILVYNTEIMKAVSIWWR